MGRETPFNSLELSWSSYPIFLFNWLIVSVILYFNENSINFYLLTSIIHSTYVNSKDYLITRVVLESLGYFLF